MNLTNYLIIINIIGLIVFIINDLLYKYTANCQIDIIVTIVCFLGGSIGVLIPVLLSKRKINKENEPVLMSRVFLFCIIPIQIILYLIYINGTFSKPLEKITTFINNNNWLVYYFIIINILTFIIFGLDKLFALLNKKRIRIFTLLLFSFFGGEIGGYFAMKLFNHKTSKDYFTYGLPLMMIMHILLLIFVIFK